MKSSEACPSALTAGGAEIEVTLRKHLFEVEGPGGAAAGTRLQFPIHLAYGTTVHKLQGLTLVHNLGRFLFLYRAFSRVRWLDRVRVLGYKHRERGQSQPNGAAPRR